MKKIYCILAVFFISIVAVNARDLSFVLAGTATHPDVLLEVPPTYVKLGVNYTGLEIFPAKATELILLGGGGYGQIALWTGSDGLPLNPASIDLFSDLLGYELAHISVPVLNVMTVVRQLVLLEDRLDMLIEIYNGDFVSAHQL